MAATNPEIEATELDTLLPQPAADEPSQFPFHVVGVGASAGGLEALERLFERMPTDTGLAFVVIQHLSPDFKSLTDDILGRRTRIPIYRVEDGMAVRPNAIFLLPPKKDMIVSGGQLLLSDKDPTKGLALPIDHFFRSLAHDLGGRAVGIILSGTGSDGSRGIRDIREAGGLVIAQAPETAKFDGMPRSAIDTGAVDLVLAPEDIPLALARHARIGLGGAESPPLVVAPLVGVDAVFRLLRDGYGIDFSQYKPETVARRLERRLTLYDVSGVDEYARQLATDPDELNLLYKDLLIGVTRFFRDPDAFDRMAQEVLPALLRRLTPGDEFRVWVAGCATGEEAYSLAILVQEAVAALGRPVPVKIFATDVHRASLEVAAAGLYPETAAPDVGTERWARYFTRTANGYQVSPELRKLIVFAPQNVLKDAPFTRLDLITCRNMLIYFLPPAQKRVLSLFHFGLKPGGVVFLGPSESAGEIGDEFEAVDHRWKIYRKRRDIRLPTDVRVTGMLGLGPTRPVPSPSPPPPDSHLLSVYDAILDDIMPPSLLVNDRREVVQSFAGASRYLKIRDGRVSTDLLEVVGPELRTALSGAIPRAFKDFTEVVYKGLRVAPPDGERIVNVSVKPIRDRRDGVTHVLIRIDESAVVPPRETAQEIDLGQASREQLLSVESELRYTKENLQAMIEEMETSNEELQSTNEELIASNEELQSTNEELQSVNEELYTVNGEYQKKITELTELTSDMDNLLTSTEVHTIFLDTELRIRKFTPKIAETFNLFPQDVGRRIDNFTYTLDHPGLLDDLRSVLQSATPRERQVRDRRGNWFLLRVLPYRAGLAVSGVVLTLIDLANVKRAEAEVRRKDEQLASILRNSPNWVFIKDLAGRYILTDDSFRRAVGCDPIGKTPHDLFPPEIAERLTTATNQVIAEGVATQFEVILPHPEGPRAYLWAKFPLRDGDGRVTGVGGVTTDVTQLKRAEETAREALLQRDRFLAMLSHELRNPLAAVLNTTRLIEMAGPAAAGEWFRVIERRTRHMARLLDDLLDVARLTSNKFEIRATVFDLARTIPDALEEARPWFTERRLVLTQSGPGGPLFVDGDPARIHQVQVNLLMNAAKYTPENGRVWYTVGREGNEAVIRVRDTGVGLTPEMLGKVFEPFVQADETLDRAGGGIGLGLTLVRSITERHGGRAEALSDGPGTGSEFVVRLPLAREQPTAPPAPAPAALPPSPARGPTQILVVEDDPDIRGSLVSILELDGYAVRAAADGPAALALLTEWGPDVALIDIGIPGLDGYEVARRIRSGPAAASMRLIALTGYGRPGDREAARLAGFDAHLTKPFNPTELAAALASVQGPAKG